MGSLDCWNSADRGNKLEKLVLQQDRAVNYAPGFFNLCKIKFKEK